jgi:predicted permease
MRNNVSLTAVVVLTMALTIGANTAIFSVANGILLKPLPFPASERLTVIREQSQTRPDLPVAYPDYLDWLVRTHAFDDMGASIVIGGILTGGGAPERVFGRAVTRSFFSTIGVTLLAGRTFTAEEDRPGGNRVMMIGYGLWQRRFGGDVSVVGRGVTYNGEAYSIVGVLPADFDFYGRANGNNDIFLPLGHLANETWMQSRDTHPLAVIGRLKPGVSLAAGRADLAAVNASLAVEYPATNAGVGVAVRTLLEDYVGDVRLALTVLVAAAALVLAVACSNVANLLMARATTRRREIAMRLAIGASHGRIVRQLLTEALMLAGVGGLLGAAAGWWATRLLPAIAGNVLPRLVDAAPDWRVAVFVMTITTLAGIVFAVTPALQLRHVDVQQLLRGGGRGVAGGGHSLRDALVAAQVALCVALLIAAGLLLRTLVTLTHVDPGYVAENVVTMRVRLPDAVYRERTQDLSFLRQLLPRLSSINGVERACLTTGVPLGRATDERFMVAGQQPAPDNQLPIALVQWVSPDCHRAFGITLIAGRYFTDADREGSAAVAIVDDELARRFFPSRPPSSALGARVRLAGAEPGWRAIVGVVRHLRHASLDEDPRPEIYAPFEQTNPDWQVQVGRAMDIAVRGPGDPEALVGAVRREVQALDSELPLSNVRTLADAVAGSLAPRRFTLALLAGFASTALILCVLGVYSVISYSVAQRTREIGVRLALGARPFDVLRLEMVRGMRPVWAGVVLGLGGAFGSARVLQRLLYGVTARDPLTFAGGGALLVLVAACASYVPARRATRVEPVVSLRE